MLLSDFLDSVFVKIEKFANEKAWYLVLIFAFIAVVLINGISLVPPQHFQMLSENPFMTRTDIWHENYFQETVLLPVLAYYTRLNTPVSFNIMCFVFAAAAYVMFAVYVKNKFGSLPALIFTLLLGASPLFTILYSWLGTPDSLTFALSVPLLFTNSFLLLFILAVSGATNHIVFVVAAAEVLILRWIGRDGIKISHLVVMTLGSAAGYLAVRAFLAFNQIQVLTRFDYLFTRTLRGWAVLNLHNLPAAFYSLFNIQWLLLFVCLVMFFKRDRIYFSFATAFLLFNYGITFFTVDTTRVFSLLSWGVFFHCIFHSYQLSMATDAQKGSYQKQFLQSALVVGILSFISIRYFAWNGKIFVTPFFEFIKQIFEILNLR